MSNKKSYGRSRVLKSGATALIAATGFSFLTVSCSAKEIQKPNIIFLLTDDQRWDALGVMGNSIIQTPNIDALAHDGVLFKNAYVTTSICVCSRASILSGQYTSRHGKNSFQDFFTPEEMQYTYPLQLKNLAGYTIGFIGKYGVGLEFPDQFFDYWAVENKHQPDYENYDEDGNFIHHNDLVEKQIVEFLETYGATGQPFNLSVSFKSPHVQDDDPRQFIPQERYKDLYAGVEIPLPVTYDSMLYYSKFPEDFRNPKFGNNKVLNEARRRWYMRFSNEEKYQESVRNHHRLVTGIDECVGIVIKKLQEMGLDKNTIIIFTSDNGFYLAEHGLAGKWYGHQESVRIPLIIYDPRLPAKKRGISIDQMVLNIDLAPTMLTLAGVEIPEQMQGADLTRLIDNKEVPWRTEFFYEHTIQLPAIPKSVGIVSEDYTYLRYYELESGFEEFYDLKNDPNQIHNLVHQSDYGTLINAFRHKTDMWEEIVK